MIRITLPPHCGKIVCFMNIDLDMLQNAEFAVHVFLQKLLKWESVNS